MPDVARFIVFMAVAFLLFVQVLLFTMRGRTEKPRVGTLMTLGGIVVILGMLFARYSHIVLYRLPWEIYYGFSCACYTAASSIVAPDVARGSYAVPSPSGIDGSGHACSLFLLRWVA